MCNFDILRYIDNSKKDITGNGMHDFIDVTRKINVHIQHSIFDEYDLLF